MPRTLQDVGNTEGTRSTATTTSHLLSSNLEATFPEVNVQESYFVLFLHKQGRFILSGFIV